MLNIPPRMLASLPEPRRATPDTPRKARQRLQKRAAYWADPEKHRARFRVENCTPLQVERKRLRDRRDYRLHRKKHLQEQAARDRAKHQAERILRAVLAILDGEPVRMRARRSKYSKVRT